MSNSIISQLISNQVTQMNFTTSNNKIISEATMDLISYAAALSMSKIKPGDTQWKHMVK